MENNTLVNDNGDDRAKEVVDLRSYVWMAVERTQMLNHELYFRGTDEQYRAFMRLFWRTWDELPAGTLPDDDRWLAQHAGYGRDLARWQEIRAGAMEGWQMSGDGRLHHPLADEIAAEAWIKKQKKHAQTAEMRHRRKQNAAARRAGTRQAA